MIDTFFYPCVAMENELSILRYKIESLKHIHLTLYNQCFLESQSAYSINIPAKDRQSVYSLTLYLNHTYPFN